ncbi:ATP-dependent DNA ligase [Candidatus Nitrosocosmicus franklandus]|uniref:DNA ligase n=1 Tax=Candidatus Nitrosocosmicus franklandianus TaxID=1798806 RepID=A0A484I9W6_9ARCH|nr:ATP-dependent DNA ligase [Candidatus Nitrosocosmicus franklandus]VFJ13017.1 DNA ligase [Candidatus Nitrosocosmicus franklandus]
MLFLELAQTFEKMEKTSSRLDLTQYLVELMKVTPSNIIDKVIYLIQGKLGPDHSSKELGIAEKMVIRSLSLATGISSSEIKLKFNEIGDLGDVVYKLNYNKSQSTLFSEPLTVERVFDTLTKIANTSGTGSLNLKIRYITSLLNNVSNLEAKYLLKLILGNLRLGIANYTLMDALAIGFTHDKGNRVILEKAFNVSSDLGNIARILAQGSIEEVQSISVSLFIPVRPMLAERAADSKEALSKIKGKCLAEFKIDGERVQVHKRGTRIELFTRSLENITSHFPEIVKMFTDLDVDNFIVEGEVVAINPHDQKFLPFQSLMRRRRKHDIQQAMEAYPVILNLFDILYHNGNDLMNLVFEERRKILEINFGNIKSDRLKLVNQKRVSNIDEIDNFMAESLDSGCEGLMLKDSNSRYRAGAREWAWIKLKKEYAGTITDSVDLVVLGALYGKGRRVGKYGALLLGSYSKEEDTFYTICKVGTGFKDDALSVLYDTLSKQIIHKKHPRVQSGNVHMDVWFEPSVVLEIISPEITLSPVYTTGRNMIKPGYGLALRFPKFSGNIREDKSPEDITTVEEIIDLYNNQFKQ